MAEFCFSVGQRMNGSDWTDTRSHPTYSFGGHDRTLDTTRGM